MDETATLNLAGETAAFTSQGSGHLRLRVVQCYRSWRAWQRRAFLCRLSSSFTGSEARAVLTALQPFFSCDLAASVAGPMPNFFACVRGPDDFAATSDRFALPTYYGSDDYTVDYATGYSTGCTEDGLQPRMYVTGPHAHAGHRHQLGRREYEGQASSSLSNQQAPGPYRSRRLSCGSDLSGTSSVCLAVRLLGRPEGHHLAAFRVYRPPPSDLRVRRFVRSMSDSQIDGVGMKSLTLANTEYESWTAEVCQDGTNAKSNSIHMPWANIPPLTHFGGGYTRGGFRSLIQGQTLK